jgi:hypothetical protein
MAKTRKTTAASSGSSSESRVPDSKLEEFAEDLGHLLGTTQAKATAWLEQRRQVLDHLTKLRDAANHYIEQLGGGAVRKRRGRPRRVSAAHSPAPASAVGTPAPQKKWTMSAEARARIGAAQRKRWAAVRRAKER